MEPNVDPVCEVVISTYEETKLYSRYVRYLLKHNPQDSKRKHIKKSIAIIYKMLNHFYLEKI